MAIVASNSITVSNVNDGSITHTAWSYSADGTDRFTTAYPNLNLLKNTKSQTYTSTGTAENNSSNKYLLDGTMADILNKPLTISYNYTITNSTGTWSGYIRPTYGLGGANQSVSNTNLSGTHKETITLTGVGFDSYRIVTSGLPAGTTVTITNLKFEPGSTATPYMPSSSEVTTADWPKYIGHYTDFIQADSTNPSDYTWGPMRGDDGVGVKSTVITYANSTSGTTEPSTGWTSSVPSLVKGQYLWTKTVWTSTDTSSKTAYSVSYNSKDGTNGTNGTSGIIVSSVAPASPKTGQLWQDTSTTPLLVKKWTGASWVIWELYAQNLKADSVSAISGNLGTMTAGIIKIIADIVINIANKTKKFGMLFTKKGLLSSGPSYEANGTISDTKMAVASLTKGELRFINTNYNDDLEQVQDSGTPSSNTGFLRFTSNEYGDLLEITSSGRIILNGLATQTSPWLEASAFAKYRVAFGTVTVSVGVINSSSSANIYLGHMPDGLRPLDSRMLYAPAWYADNSRDRHFQIDKDNGNMNIINPFPGQEYKFEVVWSIPY